MNDVCAVIPARLESTRLPRKVLAEIAGRPMLWHVWSRVTQARRIGSVVIATDSAEVESAARAWGAEVLITSSGCRSGTERIASILEKLPGGRILNVQGDEPLMSPELLDALVGRWNEAPADLITAVFRIETLAELQSPSLVKVVRAHDGRALYFSRAPVPHVRDAAPEAWLAGCAFWGHVGVYGYRRAVLARYPELPPSPLEEAEKLEQLRFLEAGFGFQTVETGYRPIAVDVPADLERVRSRMLRDKAESYLKLRDRVSPQKGCDLAENHGHRVR